MSIHEMYGLLAEQQEATEAARKFLHGLVGGLRLGVIKPAQVELTEDGGFKVNPLPEEESDVDAEEAPRKDE